MADEEEEADADVEDSTGSDCAGADTALSALLEGACVRRDLLIGGGGEHVSAAALRGWAAQTGPSCAACVVAGCVNALLANGRDDPGATSALPIATPLL